MVEELEPEQIDEVSTCDPPFDEAIQGLVEYDKFNSIV
jgi:hypothetical protein